MTTEHRAEELRKAGFGDGEKPLDSLAIRPETPGQSYPRHYPHPNDALGEPLTVRQVARLLGCSDWTVRHGYLPQGMPHFRSGPMGKLVFFRNQIVDWILQRQRKGGM